MADRDPGEYMKGVIEKAKQYKECPVNITGIYDLGPNFTDRYTIMTTSIDGETSETRALIFDDQADLYSKPHGAHWLSISLSQPLGKRILFKDLPADIQNYLDDYDIKTQEDRQLREWARKPHDSVSYFLRQLDGPEANIEDFLDWIADRMIYVYKEKPNADFILSIRKRAASARSIRFKST